MIFKHYDDYDKPFQKAAAQWLEAICANNPVFCAKHPPFEFAFSPSAPKVGVSKTEIRIESFDIKNSKVCTFKFSSGDILAQQKSTSIPSYTNPGS